MAEYTDRSCKQNGNRSTIASFTLFLSTLVGCWLVVLRCNATVTAKVISWRSVTHMCFLVFSHQYLHKFLSKATDYFSHMLQQRWEAKVCREESSPQPGLELTTIRSRVRHAHPWAIRAGPVDSGLSTITQVDPVQYLPLLLEYATVD